MARRGRKEAEDGIATAHDCVGQVRHEPVFVGGGVEDGYNEVGDQDLGAVNCIFADGKEFRNQWVFQEVLECAEGTFGNFGVHHGGEVVTGGAVVVHKGAGG